MKTTILVVLISFLSLASTIDLKSFYDTLSGNSVEAINSTISNLEKEKNSSRVRAYLGAMIAKKANFEKKPINKIQTFKKGIKLLEAEITANSNKPEYRFLRLTIQENCPKILKYNKNIEEDMSLIIKNYVKIKNPLQTIILDYSKTSKRLSSALLK